MSLSDKTQTKDRFIVLHGLRGVAAVMVALSHAGMFLPGQPDLVPGGYLAVDLFFLLSGFVIAHAYDDRLARGLSFRDFAIARLVRLYPLYFVALFVAAAVVSLTILTKGIGEYSRVSLLATFLLSPFFLPTPAPVTWSDQLFPLDGPTWSLLFELAVNAGYALIAVLVGRRSLLAIVIAAAVALALTDAHFGALSGGAKWSQWWSGVPRVVFSFSLGVLLRRYHLRPSKMSNAGALALAGLCVAVMLVNVEGSLRPYLDFVVVAAVWPFVVLVGSRVSLQGPAALVSEFSGETSYAMYVLHIPVLGLLSLVTWIFTGAEDDQHTWLWLVSAIAALIAISALLGRSYDKPVRRTITERLGRRKLSIGPAHL